MVRVSTPMRRLFRAMVARVAPSGSYRTAARRLTLACLLAAGVAFGGGSHAFAQSQRIGDTELFQLLLIWTGDYSGMVDGIVGPGTKTALDTFLTREFSRVPESWTEAHTDRLVERAVSAIEASGFRLHRDRQLDVTFAVPEALMRPVDTPDPMKRIFRSPDDEIELQVANLENRAGTLDLVYRRLVGISGREVTYSRFQPTWFVITGHDAGKGFYVRYHLQDREVRGFSISYPSSRAIGLNPIVVAMSNVFQPTAATTDELVAFLEDLQQEADAPRAPRRTAPPAASVEGPGADIRIETVDLDGEELTIIVVDGDLVYGDERRFASAALSVDRGFVLLNSAGGNLHAGIEIGKAIRLKGFATGVPDGAECASACALAWLAGSPRFMASDTSIGFHAAFRIDGEQVAVSASANAQVGAYLNQLGLTTRAVVYITDALPHEMQWLTFADATALGIETQRFDSAPVDSVPAASAAASPAECFSREYDAKHLADHPDQLVRRMWLVLTTDDPNLATVKADQAFEIGMQVRGRAGWLSTGGYCRRDDGETVCTALCDGGGVSVVLRHPGILVNLEQPFGRIALGSCDQPDGGFELASGIDDKSFRLDSVACDNIPEMGWSAEALGRH